ncbi:hypothetical protein [Stieleria varia]|uniref:Uncharacterized protein n=1 Tax=Stieleria varia TaxID=2528005 RepID=A0A5C5ZS18_9BACT|nr:hypothetical protein [Stieleria varia]TWT89591.1 hypothetical protein Pla52n_67180 [Stieleria varia]
MSNDTKQPSVFDVESPTEATPNPGLSYWNFVLGLLAVTLLLCFIVGLFMTGYLAAFATGAVIVIGLLGFADPRD